MADDQKPADNPVDAGTGGAAADPTPQPVGGDDLGFTKKQMEQLATLTGRIFKKQFEENVLPTLKPQSSPADHVPASVGGDDPIKKYNETLQQRIFEGDVIGAIRDAAAFNESVKTGVLTNNQKQVKQLLTGFAEKPLYKEVYGDAEKIAFDAVAAGYPPQAAAEYAYYKAYANHSMNKHNGDDLDSGSLGHLEGGKPPSRGRKEFKLPPQYEDACSRDIKKGLFKTRDEWIQSLSPQVRSNLEKI